MHKKKKQQQKQQKEICFKMLIKNLFNFNFFFFVVQEHNENLVGLLRTKKRNNKIKTKKKTKRNNNNCATKKKKSLGYWIFCLACSCNYGTVNSEIYRLKHKTNKTEKKIIKRVINRWQEKMIKTIWWKHKIFFSYCFPVFLLHFFFLFSFFTAFFLLFYSLLLFLFFFLFNHCCYFAWNNNKLSYKNDNRQMHYCISHTNLYLFIFIYMNVHSNKASIMSYQNLHSFLLPKI